MKEVLSVVLIVVGIVAAAFLANWAYPAEVEAAPATQVQMDCYSGGMLIWSGQARGAVFVDGAWRFKPVPAPGIVTSQVFKTNLECIVQ